jgi:lysophospholipase L1-like esterase
VTIAPTQVQVQTALRTFLAAILPAGTDIIIAQQNRVPEPSSSNFVVMTPIRMTRLRTNVDTSMDCKFTGSIIGNVLTVTDVQIGLVAIGATVWGEEVAANTVITAGPSNGGNGNYAVSGTSQTVASSTMSSGQTRLEQGAEVVVQLDFHSADASDADMAQTVSTVLRDSTGVDMFANQSPNYGVVPLYADDPAQRPFINENQQYEWRWVLEAHLQINQVVAVPQQYTDAADITAISVDAIGPWVQTFIALSQQAQVQSGINTPHQNPNMPNPPVVTTTIGAGLSVNLEIPDISWFTSMGGDFQFFLSAWGWFLCATQAATGGINGTGQNPVVSRIWIRTSAPKISFLVLGQTLPYRFLVDGYYVDKAGTLTSATSGATFLTLDFGSSASRDIGLELQRVEAIFGIFIAPSDVVIPLPLRPMKCIVLGDSITAGAGTTVSVADGVWPQTAERLGFDYYRASGVGGTGYVNDAGGTLYNLPERIIPDAVTPGADLFIIAMGLNDKTSPPDQITANAQSCVNSLRSAHPACVIILVGPYDAAAPLPVTPDYTATKNAIFAVANPENGIFTVDLTGVAYDQNGPPHPSDAGALTLSNFITSAIYSILQVS